MQPAPMVALAAALLLTIPATALAALPGVEAPEAPDVAAAAPAAAATEALADLARGFGPGAGFGDQLLRAATLDATASAPALGGATFDEAFAALYAAAGVPQAEVEAEPALAASLAPLVAATAAAGALAQEAFAPLSADERAFLAERLPLVLAPIPGDAATEADLARLADVAGRVDRARLVVGAALLAEAIDAFAPPAQAQSWTDPNGLVEVGGTGNECFFTERVLIVDLGGNDCYANHPGSYAPGSGLKLPVSAIVELGGNDYYTATSLHPGSGDATWGSGVGILGIGLVADRWGDDVHYAGLYDATATCPQDFWTGNRQYVYAQGVGALGVGAVLDASGNDVYEARNTNLVETNCHFGWTYTFAQAVGIYGGLGLLLDDTGDDRYGADATSSGEYDNIAHTYAQGASAAGVALLADKEGSDSYWATSNAFLGGVTWKIKGDFAYVFSQGSVTATRLGPAVANVQVDAGLPGGCFVIPLLNRRVCIEDGGERPVGLSCRMLGSQMWFGAPDNGCDTPAAALLLDLLGDDVFVALPYSSDRGYGCSAASWAVSSSQGSAAWSGLAALATFDAGTRDAFVQSPYAEGSSCPWLGTLAHAYGQGFGGAIQWNYWDVPGLGPEHLAIGVLANGGPLLPACFGPDGDPAALRGVAVLRDLATIEPACEPAVRLDPAMLAAKDDAYVFATAINPPAQGWCWPTCPAMAAAWVQGSAQRAVTTVQNGAANGPAFQALGIGIHADAGGDDENVAQAYARNSRSVGADALVVGQGGARGGIGVHADAGGNDRYDALAMENGAAKPGKTLVQARADGSIPVGLAGACAVFVCTPAIQLGSIPAVGVLVDVSGWDAYSEGAEAPFCQGDGVTFGGWLGLLGVAWWGNAPLVAPPCGASTGLAVGHDWLSEAGL